MEDENIIQIIQDDEPDISFENIVKISQQTLTNSNHNLRQSNHDESMFL